MTRKITLALFSLLILSFAGCTEEAEKTKPQKPHLMTVDSSTDIHVMKVHANPAIENAPSAVFMHLHNVGTEDDLLMGASTPVAKVMEIHQSRFENGMMMMDQKQHLLIPAGMDVHLKHGGYHLMLIGLKQDLNKGETISVTLHFKRSGDITLQVPVMFVAPSGPAMEPKHHHMHH